MQLDSHNDQHTADNIVFVFNLHKYVVSRHHWTIVAYQSISKYKHTKLLLRQNSNEPAVRTTKNCIGWMQGEKTV